MMVQLRRAVLLGAAVGLAGVLLSMTGGLLELEEKVGLAALFTVRGPIAPPDDVAVISISGDSAEAFGLSSDVDEWPRALHAQLIDRLADAGAAAIVFDIIFDSARSPSGDRKLAEAVGRAGNVILLERVRSRVVEIQGASPVAGAVVEKRIPPIEPLRRGALATAPFVLPVVPIRVGQFWAFGRAAGDTPTLPAAALHAYALPAQELFMHLVEDVQPGLIAHLPDLRPEGLGGLEQRMRALRGALRRHPFLRDHLGSRIEEIDVTPRQRRLLRALNELYCGPDSRYLNFYGPARTITTVPYHHVLEPRPGVEQAVRGKVVFVGFSERRQPEQQDAFFSVFSQRSGQNLSGVEIGATAFANMLESTSVKPLPLPVHWLVVALWGLAIAGLCVCLTAPAALLSAGAAAAAYGTWAALAFASSGVWMPVVVPLLIQLPIALIAALAWNFQRVRQQRERIHSALGYYLPAAVVDRLAHQTVNAQSDRELVFGTCLVTDAEQYTTLSEALHPAELGQVMNDYYQVLVDAVTRHGGLVSDIAGDSMVAVWPVTSAVGASHAAACAAAVDVQRAVETFNRGRFRYELPTRIGIDSGQLLLGNIGSSRRGEYRAVGDIVNTASRLQGLNRHLGTRVLLSLATAAEAEGLVTRPLGDFLLLGKQLPISVLELQRLGDTDSFLSDLNGRFAAALEAFRAGRWKEAERSFNALLERYPEDGASRFFSGQCATLGGLYPDGGWDGVVRMTVK